MQDAISRERILFIEFLLSLPRDCDDHFCGRNDHPEGGTERSGEGEGGSTAGGRHFYKARRENNQPPPPPRPRCRGRRLAIIAAKCGTSHPVNIPLRPRPTDSSAGNQLNAENEGANSPPSHRDDPNNSQPQLNFGERILETPSPTGPKTCLGPRKIH